MRRDIFSLLDEMQTIARNGLHFATDPYDRERYTRLMALAEQQYTALLEMPGEQLRARFRAEIGYITPKVGADGAIFNAAGEILLMDRADGSGWCLPCGWVEPHEAPHETVVREVFEETGLQVEIERLVGVFTRPPNARTGPHTMVAVVHLCRIVGGELTLSHEGKGLRYWPLDAVPDWHPNHDLYAREAQRMWASQGWLPAISG